MPHMNRRRFLKTAAGLAGMATFPARARAVEPSETVRIGYLPITDASPLLLAHGLGYFGEEGLAVEPPIRIRDWSTLAESFLSGKFNLVHLLLPIPVWMRYHLGAPVKIMAWDHTNGSAITVDGSSSIKSFADLGGKQIAVPYWYSMHNVILQLGLRTAGLTPVIQPQGVPLKPNEVNLFILPPPEMPVSLAARKIDGFTVAEPFNAFAELKINARIMRFTGDIWKNHPCCVVVMKEELIKSRPVFTQKVINAVVRAQLWATRNREAAAQLLAAEGKGYLPAPAQVLSRVFTGYGDIPEYAGGAIRHPEWGINRIGFQPYPYPSATRFLLSEMKKTLVEGSTDFLKTLDPDHVVKDLVVYDVVKRAIMTAGGPGQFEIMDYHHPWDREESVAI